ncbi:urate hydroxylase PuuD [Paracraurococcus lichenis]|uniref:Urate hydroxylase PuuD n=1 Tax=Paracraurococcus lichenis TaxID=3064888 RepID=A0ABT9E350_9PROT|nr:urate hydroxylase PuuD [Paracraurococcus sp. LOR1-02]MDO9710430.1 urate hydroxylase PuuD [Paracraurococcus sp. LOR1-02]
MDPYLHEWGGMLLRWLHVLAGMAWIGSSFYFMHVDAMLKPAPDIPAGKGGQIWEVHGGGFYQVRKWLVAPSELPPDLLWHKWEAYTTWLSGFALLAWVYYGASELFLIDPAVADIGPVTAAAIGIGSLVLGWVAYDRLCKSPLGEDEVKLAAIGFAFVVLVAFLFQQVFSGRGAMIHTGALMATWMAGNVAMIIIPNQRKVIAALLAGQAPDPALGKAGKVRSTHNNYLTLPVLFLMLANHYPILWSTPYAFVVVGLILIAGAVIRVFYNLRHSGRGNPWWTWAVAAACILLAGLVSLTSSPVGRERLGLAAREAPGTTLPHGVAAPPAEVVEIVTGRCSMCHAAEPVWAGIPIAPKGVRLDTPEHIAREAAAIRTQAVLSHAMPPNNITGLEPAERRVLAAWLAQ